MAETGDLRIFSGDFTGKRTKADGNFLHIG
jgi:hypothetical protein